MKLIYMKAHELHELIKKKEIKAEEIAAEHIERIKEADREINAFITFKPDEIIGNAKKIDKYIA
ncbi:MAG TPA: Asp-tRNA(Asn)/Glu-tRNA(Gln) amidotransferase GatCAB subunit A, partial [Actinobacteria bacterium]|nr:Asp-tRNA(Asn)/Glu-tRNA(Gln) amidotransferase GatCAB subunit A [Actinomycetota bacterium]